MDMCHKIKVGTIMIKLYRRMSFFRKNEVLDDPEMFFINRISASDLSPDSLKMLKIIDNATLLDVKSGRVETPFEVCSIDDLSTGCKVAACVVYLNEHRKDFEAIKAVYATIAGVNALDCIFDYLEKTNFDMPIIVEQEDIFDCKDRIYRVDGEITVDSLLTMHEVE